MTDGILDREKVIQALRRCIYDPDPGQTKKEIISCDECPYYHGCTHDLMRDALDLLKERRQQPHSKTFTVIDRKTGKEADEYNIALREDWAQRLVYCDMDGFALKQDGTLLLCDECGTAVVCDPERFEVVWDE